MRNRETAIFFAVEMDSLAGRRIVCLAVTAASHLIRAGRKFLLRGQQRGSQLEHPVFLELCLTALTSREWAKASHQSATSTSRLTAKD